jgi:hypothetical protein
MNRRIKKSASLVFLVAVIGALATRDLRAQDDGASLHVAGDAAAVQLDVRKTTLNDVLSALSGSFDVSYSSKIALTELRDGTYQGSLRQVIARVLDGYDYAIRQERSKLDVTVFDKVGGQAVPAPQQHSVSAHRAALKRASQ